MEFLVQNKIGLNYNRSTLEIEGKSIQLYHEIKESWNDNPDSRLVEKIQMLKDDHEISKDRILQEINEISSNQQKLGSIPNIKHEINLINDIAVASKSFRIPFKLQTVIDAEIQRLLKQNIIRPSSSPYASPAFIVPKKDGTGRLVIDYRKLNRITVKEAFPIPQIEDQFLMLGNSSFFSQIDLNSGYHQLLMKDEDIFKTSFVLPNGQYEFLRMPFGLSNAPRTFQRSMNALFQNLPFVKIFIDDILIHSVTLEHHISHLKEVINILKQHNITINSEKSNFFKQEVSYLGSIISSKGRMPDTSRIHIQECKSMPTTISQLRGWLGYLNWYRPFIPKLSEKLSPLNEKLKMKVKFLKLTKEEIAIINDTMDMIKKQPMLEYPDFNIDFQLHTDASDISISAILKQENKLIGIYNKKLSDIQRKYTVVEREALAIIKGLEHFKTIIYNSKINIFTDSANQLFIGDSEKQRNQRWKLLLEEYNYSLNYIKGVSNVGADFLSKNLIIAETKSMCPWILEEIKAFQEKDKLITEMFRNNKLKLTVCENISLITNQNEKIYIPNSYVHELIRFFHLKLEHPGYQKQYKTMVSHYTFKNIKKNIREYINNCTICQLNKINTVKYGKIEGDLISKEPWNTIATDLFGPIELEEYQRKGKGYILVIIDTFSRWVRLKLLKHISARNVCNAIKELWLNKYIKPLKIISDQGSQFISKTFMNLCEEFKIKHSICTAYNPSGNGIAERFNKNLANGLRCLKGTEIKSALMQIEETNQISYHRSIKHSPYEIIHSKSPFDITQQSKEINLNDIYYYQKWLSQKNNLNINKLRINTFKFEIGKYVYIKRRILKNKLDNQWKGPAEIVATKSNSNVVRCRLGSYYEWTSSIILVRIYTISII